MESNQVDTASTEVPTVPPAACSSTQQQPSDCTTSNYSPPNAFQPNLNIPPLKVSCGMAPVGYIAPATNQFTASRAPVDGGLVAQPEVLTCRHEQVVTYSAHFLFAFFHAFFCIITGLIAMYLAEQARLKHAAGDKAGARKLGNISVAVSLSTIVVMVIVIVVVVPVEMKLNPRCSGYKDASGVCYEQRTVSVNGLDCSMWHPGGHYEGGYCYYNYRKV